MAKITLTQSRREFIKYLGTVIIGGFMVLWYALTQRHMKLTGGPESIKINLSGKPDGFYFYNSFIASKKGQSVKVFSNRCSHAGCKINKEHNNRLVCACHGSEYSSSGEVLKGPATKNLIPLSFSFDEEKGEITVRV